ncbi:MAG: discoidin domain-containing protein [Lachnospiraceae bacterium]|nr:discoidin domain-containing protein [Lachnospiraceae bacterium]
MYVFFTAPASGEATLTLSKLEGEGASYFDDVRVVESDAKNITFDKNGEISRFTQDFEKSVQGLYPFVVGGIEGVEDNRIHLSELHAPYTQAGWDVKKMDDVLDGNWSVKINGLTRRNAIAFQTIPQNFRFEPGVKYHVSFKYQSGTDGIYAVVKGSGEKITSNPEPLALAMGKDADATYETDIVGDESGQTWFGIYSTGKAANTQGNSGAAANFGGYQDFVLDDLVIERVDEVVTEDELKTLIEKAKAELTKENLSNANYKKALEAIAKAEVALKEDGKSQKGINIAYNSLKELMKALEGSSKEADPEDASNDLPLEGMVASAGSIQTGYQEEGPAELAIDGNENTIWHTNWDGTTLDKMWLDIRLKEATTVAGVRLLQRGGGLNGRIARAEIKVLKKGETEYKTVKTVTLKSSGWNLVTFDAEKDVTNVRIQALQTLGSPANNFASLAEVRVVKEAKEEDAKPDKSALKNLVKKAEELKTKYEAGNNIAVLEEKIKEAKAVLAKEDATYFDILLAQANLKKAVSDLKAGVYKKAEEKPAQKPAIDPNAIPVIPVQVIIPNEAANPSQTVDVNEDDTAKGSTGNSKKEALLKKDKRILKALKEVKTETKAIKALVRSKKLNILANLKNYRKAAKNDKKFLSVKKDVNSAISYLEKNKITTSKSLLKRLTKLNKELKKLQASMKNAKNEARIKKVQEEIASIKLVTASLKNAKKFFEK